MNDDALDREIREAVEPNPEAVARVVGGALDQKGGRSGSLWPLSLLTGLVVLVVAVVLLKTSDRRADVTGPQPVNAGVTQITNINETVVVRPASGGVWLVGGAQKDGRLPPGTIVVHKSGDLR
jgi:hypothetical protein